MKEMSYDEIGDINGGMSIASFCTIAGAISVFFPNPYTGVISIGCAGYALGSMFNN